jgi:hypothetical protein
MVLPRLSILPTALQSSMAPGPMDEDGTVYNRSCIELTRTEPAPEPAPATNWEGQN